MKKKVLMIDDDLNVCKEIKYALESDTTTVYYATSASDGLEQLSKQHFCLVIMDVFLSEANGLFLLKEIRQMKTIPILVLASDPHHAQKISALNAGATGYLGKPYELEECLAHAQSLMQLFMALNRGDERCYTLVFGVDLIIDPVRHQAMLKGESMELTRKEFDLLFCLAVHAGQVLSREQLFSQVWPHESGYDVDASIKNHIRNLRKKLNPSGREYIKNIWGVGYRFSACDVDEK